MLTPCLLTLTLLATTGDITPFSSGGVVTTANAFLVQLADMDGDGDLDVAYGVFFSLNWCENLDGLGTWSAAKPIDAVPGGATTPT